MTAEGIVGETGRPVASAVAIVLLLVLVLPMMIYQYIQSKESEA